MTLSIGEKVRILLRRKKTTIAALAILLGTSRQNLTNKLNRDNLTEKDLKDIAEALGCQFEVFFIFADGEKI